MAVSITVPTTEPASVHAGDTWTWKKTLSDYLADEWTLTYHCVVDEEQLQIEASASGTDHLVEVAASTTAGYAPGTYKYQARVVKDSEKYVVGSGTLVVKPDYAAASSGYDDRSHAKTVLDAIEAVLENKATLDQSSVSIAGRALSRFTWDELIAARKRYRAEYLAEERKAGRRKTAVKVQM